MRPTLLVLLLCFALPACAGDPPAGTVEFVESWPQHTELDHPDLRDAAVDVLVAATTDASADVRASAVLALARTADVKLEIYDARGARVRNLLSGVAESGTRVLVWDGRDDSGSVVPSGVYYARARGGWGATESQRMTLLK